MLYKVTPAILLLVLLAVSTFYFFKNSTASISSFEECASAGNSIMESYPRQCRDAQGNVFVENIGNELAKQDLIQISSPRPGEVVSSPLRITGQARGVWFFEATFPVVLVDWDGRIIAESFAIADGEWMTENFVPFTATLIFEKPTYGKKMTLILRKDNPSGLPEHDDALEVPIFLE